MAMCGHKRKTGSEAKPRNRSQINDFETIAECLAQFPEFSQTPSKRTVALCPSACLQKSLKERLAILSDAAKYDASCASSGTDRRDSSKSGGLGSTEGSGICHAYVPDGRCISLLKILLTNFCIYDCAYCINRSSSNVERARFTPDEVVWLTIEFYRRNYIEGLFLSSGIIRSSDDT
eukprot:gene39971-54044_t